LRAFPAGTQRKEPPAAIGSATWRPRSEIWCPTGRTKGAERRFSQIGIIGLVDGFEVAASCLRSFHAARVVELRIRRKMDAQSCARGYTASMASGKPRRLPTAVIRISSILRFYSSLKTLSPNLAPSVCSIHSPNISSCPSARQGRMCGQTSATTSSFRKRKSCVREPYRAPGIEPNPLRDTIRLQMGCTTSHSVKVRQSANIPPALRRVSLTATLWQFIRYLDSRGTQTLQLPSLIWDSRLACVQTLVGVAAEIATIKRNA